MNEEAGEKRNLWISLRIAKGFACVASQMLYKQSDSITGILTAVYFRFLGYFKLNVQHQIVLINTLQVSDVVFVQGCNTTPV